MARQSGQIPLNSAQVRRAGLMAALGIAIILLVTGLIVSDSWSHAAGSLTAPEKGGITGAPHDGQVIEQDFSLPFTTLDRAVISLAPVGSAMGGSLSWELISGDGSLASGQINLADMGGSDLGLNFEQGLAVGQQITLRLIFHEEDVPGELPAAYIGSQVNAGRLTVDAANLDALTVDGAPLRGRLCASLYGHRQSAVMRWYWPIAALLTLLAVLWSLAAARLLDKGRRTRLLWIIEALRHYAFLIRQLVARDFNTKYRQSILGVLWSFLNPLLTMTVQYIVFSALFRSTIPNFPVYLLTGIVLFNFFSEACTLGLDSIVMNGALITKVYMPKYIYPLSRTLSSAINLLISLVPLLLLMALTRVPFTPALLLLPLDLALLMAFTLGMSLILCTLNVFFRDTRFLWSVAVLLWTYLTPLFYPESIIPAAFHTLYHMNPMYQYITFLRAITLEGGPPTPLNVAAAALSSAVTLALGAWVFRRKQDQFVFHL